VHYVGTEKSVVEEGRLETREPGLKPLRRMGPAVRKGVSVEGWKKVCGLRDEKNGTAYLAGETGLSPAHFQKPSPVLRPSLPAETLSRRGLGMTNAGSLGYRCVHPSKI